MLVATGTFWQGVDIPGEALSLLVIDKLPFQPPDDPLVEARCERITAEGGDWFADYCPAVGGAPAPPGVRPADPEPQRSRRRLPARSAGAHAPYGRAFLESLPPCRVVEDREAVREFLGAGALLAS